MSKTNTSVLSDIPLHQRTAAKGQANAATSPSFSALRLSAALTQGIMAGPLSDLEYASPSDIQALAIPKLVAGCSTGAEKQAFLLAAETGSGKTLAYLAPILHHLKKHEAERGEGFVRAPGHPGCVIVVPSIELVKQVGGVVKALSHHVKFSATTLLPSFSFRRAKNAVLVHPVDVLVTMPSQLSNLLAEGIVKLDTTRFVVVDEADTLFDISFEDTMETIIKHVKRSVQHLVLCSATIPRSLDSFLRKHYPDIERLVSSKIHAIPRRVAMKFVDIEKEFKGNKDRAAHQILRDLAQDGTEPGKVKKVILFVNKRETIAPVATYLRERNIDCLEFSKDSPDRGAAINQFLSTEENVIASPAEQDSSETDVADEAQPLEEAVTASAPDKNSLKVLITTDLASRGIDTIAVKNVVLYDVPYSTIDFIHRVGRTGRAGRRGRAFVLVNKETGNQWIKDVKRMVINGMPLI
ncbi:P-loop containing nucleoside triphosphate hydrolase protein [Protomyces lactucae-debilis]|uniref:RNA helicase n=1 Tax=Protomyces lactucae-debilis TaxID=2754530 RepID=A0A1Y2F544_PROLT|nr:P-loop containing nucleoside triphosphate hydrolase protein [Protomyces lactucae-debilis]ORY79002.1 P-loop containing nucleoside triphosphate hydrolase protein [Protomyces lactucae-debilis]